MRNGRERLKLSLTTQLRPGKKVTRLRHNCCIICVRIKFRMEQANDGDGLGEILVTLSAAS